MSRKATLDLEFKPRKVEYYGDVFLIYYKSQGDEPVPYVDVFDKAGKPLSRVDLESIMTKHQLSLKQILGVKFPRLSWSDRKIEEFDVNKRAVLKKVIVAGSCLF